MGVSNRHILSQGPVIRAIGHTAFRALRQRVDGVPESGPELPGREFVERIRPRPKQLVRDYLRHVGGDPSAWKGRVPPHLFPQWGFGLSAKALADIPYPLMRVMNGGSRVTVNADVPDDVPLTVRARLESIDDDGRRAVLETRIITGTPDHDEALVSHLYAIVPVGSGKGAAKPKKKERPRVPADAREVAAFRVGTDAGLSFAKLTGDFNPLHWVPAYARAMGFRNVILHGFATMARAWEGVTRGVYAGRVDAIRSWSCRFTRPLVLPASASVFVHDHGAVYVGDAAGGPAYLTGTHGENP